MLARSITLVVLLALGPPTGLLAQLRGHVFGPGSQPLGGALVELWAPLGRVAHSITDSRGQFTFRQADLSASLVLFVRRVGYAPVRVEVDSSEVTVSMTPFAETQRAIRADANLCPRDDDQTARARWESVRKRYAPRSLAYWSDARVSMARVPPSALGAVDTSLTGPGSMGAGADYFERQTARITEQGYAVPFAGLRQPRYDLWEYPFLESLLAAHFIDTLFGDLHTLSWFDETETSVVFCTRNRDRPAIEGIMVLSPDSILERVRWRFVTPAPSEDAGGEVLFANPVRAARPAFLPAVGLYWRKLVFDYYQEWWEFRRWQTCETDPDTRFCQ